MYIKTIEINNFRNFSNFIIDFTDGFQEKWGHRKNGVKSTVDPCSKLIRAKSRLDPSDPSKKIKGSRNTLSFS